MTIMNRYDLKKHLIEYSEQQWIAYLDRNRRFKEKEKTDRNEAVLRSIQYKMDRILSAMKDLKGNQNDYGSSKGKVDGNYGITNEGNELDKGNQELLQWLRDTVELSQYFEVFRDHGFDDLESLKYMTIQTMDQIGITKIGHRLKLMDYIQRVFSVDDK